MIDDNFLREALEYTEKKFSDPKYILEVHLVFFFTKYLNEYYEKNEIDWDLNPWEWKYPKEKNWRCDLFVQTCEPAEEVSSPVQTEYPSKHNEKSIRNNWIEFKLLCSREGRRLDVSAFTKGILRDICKLYKGLPEIGRNFRYLCIVWDRKLLAKNLRARKEVKSLLFDDSKKIIEGKREGELSVDLSKFLKDERSENKRFKFNTITVNAYKNRIIKNQWCKKGYACPSMFYSLVKIDPMPHPRQ